MVIDIHSGHCNFYTKLSLWFAILKRFIHIKRARDVHQCTIYYSQIFDHYESLFLRSQKNDSHESFAMNTNATIAFAYFQLNTSRPNIWRCKLMNNTLSLSHCPTVHSAGLPTKTEFRVWSAPENQLETNQVKWLKKQRHHLIISGMEWSEAHWFITNTHIPNGRRHRHQSAINEEFHFDRLKNPNVQIAYEYRTVRNWFESLIISRVHYWCEQSRKSGHISKLQFSFHV